jgi:hypothetical protein
VRVFLIERRQTRHATLLVGYSGKGNTTTREDGCELSLLQSKFCVN